MSARIHAIQTGTVRVKSNQIVGKGVGIGRQLNMVFGSEWAGHLPILAWLIDHPEGPIVVDTGESALASQPGYFPSWHPFYRWAVRISVAPREEIGPQLAQMGISAGDVKTVVLTHLHTDHAGGLSHFAGCDVLVHSAELTAAKRRLAVMNGYLPHLWPPGFAPRTMAFDSAGAGPFDAVHYLTRAGDVMVVPTPGHTAGHVSVIVRHDGINYFLAGDTTYTERALLARQVDGVSPSGRQALRTMDRILAYAVSEPTVYLPSHDPDSIRRLRSSTLLAPHSLEPDARIV